MKITYLAYTQQPDKSTRLSVVSYDEWKQIVQENRVLPAEKRRYFITDCFQDTDTLDCMVIETSYEEYRKWNRERMASKRNRNLGQKICILSLNTYLKDSQDCITLEDVLQADDHTEKKTIDKVQMEALQKELEEWRPWGLFLLELYLAGEHRNCVPMLVGKYKVSPQTARKYKRQFEKFLKNFFGGVSF